MIQARDIPVMDGHDMTLWMDHDGAISAVRKIRSAGLCRNRLATEMLVVIGTRMRVARNNHSCKPRMPIEECVKVQCVRPGDADRPALLALPSDRLV